MQIIEKEGRGRESKMTTHIPVLPTLVMLLNI